jgi:hypothetical protein
VFVAGIPVRDESILELARLVEDPDLARRLEDAYGRMTKILGLSIAERETIIRALDDPPPGLEELRAVLLREHVRPSARRARVDTVSFATTSGASETNSRGYWPGSVR